MFISRLRNTYGPTFKHRDLRPYLQLLGLPGSLKARPLKPAEAPDPRLGGQPRRDAIDYTHRELFPWTRLTSKLETHKDRSLFTNFLRWSCSSNAGKACASAAMRNSHLTISAKDYTSSSCRKLTKTSWKNRPNPT